MLEQQTGIILVAAGTGERLGLGVPKAQALCGGITLLEHALSTCLESGVAAYTCVVVPAGDTMLRAIIDSVTGSQRHRGTVTAVDGGASRPESVRAGLAALPSTISHVLVHDAARALTPVNVFQRVAETLVQGARAVIPGVEVVDTIKSVSGGQVTGTPSRANLRAIQTPQGFSAGLLRRAHDTPADGHITDDAMLIESLGIPVNVVEGAAEAFKITTPQDLILAESILQRRHP